MPIYEVREKFTVVMRLGAASEEEAIAKWKGMATFNGHGQFTPLANAMLNLLDRDLQNLPADVPAGLRKKLAAMPDKRKPVVREVFPYELKADREAADREYDDGFQSSLLP